MARSRTYAGIGFSQVMKAFFLGLVFGCIFLYFEPDDELENDNSNIAVTETETMEIALPRWTRRPTPFPTTNAPTGFSCKTLPEVPLWVQDAKLNPKNKIYDQIDVKNPDLKFYIDPSFDSRPLLSCFFNVLGVSPSSNSKCKESNDLWDCAINLSDIQHLSNFHPDFDHVLTDIAIMEGFRNHHNRVYYPEEANAVVVDILPTLSYAMPDLHHFQCDPSIPTSHSERMQAAEKKLQEKDYFKDNTRLYLLTVSAPPGAKSFMNVIGNELAEVFHSSKNLPVLLTTTSRYFKHQSLSRPMLKRAMQIPQILSGFIHREKANGQEQSEIKLPHQRKYTFFIDEVFTPRARVIKILDTLKEALIDILPPNELYMFSRGKQQTFLDPRATRAVKMADSKFCLIISGVDGVHAKSRLYDALVSGCIPIVLQTEIIEKDLTINNDGIRLPFPARIEWKRVGYFLTSLRCISAYPTDTALYLQKLNDDSKTDEGLLETKQMQTYGQEVYGFLRVPNTIPDYRLEANKVISNENEPREEKKSEGQEKSNSNKTTISPGRLLQEDDETENVEKKGEADVILSAGTTESKSEFRKPIQAKLYKTEYDKGVIDSILSELELKPRYKLE